MKKVFEKYFYPKILLHPLKSASSAFKNYSKNQGNEIVRATTYRPLFTRQTV
jgi:hypothetical protein